MSRIIIFGSEDCPSWDRTRAVRKKLERDEEVPLPIEVLDPADHQERFRRLGLTICPSMVVDEEVISVGPPSFDYVKNEILDRLDSNDEQGRAGSGT